MIPNALDNAKWEVRVGPGIGGPNPFIAPRSFTITPPSGASEWMQVAIDGVGYTDGMAAYMAPWVANSGSISMEFDFMTDNKAPMMAQAIEADIRICDPQGYNYNGSWQINYQQGGEIQVYGVKPNPAWTNTGLKPGKLLSWTPYRIRVNYVLDYVKHAMTLVSSEINGVVYKTPAALHNVPGELLKWTPGLYNQLQLDLAHAGGSFSVFYRNILNVCG